MDLNSFMHEVHANAVAHGFWDVERPIEETMALIHSEWSEALEEYRADRPMYYKVCTNCGEPCMRGGCGDYYDGVCALKNLDPKPEGIAVELIDGCLRIMDYLDNVIECIFVDSSECEKLAVACLVEAHYDDVPELPTIVGLLHSLTSECFSNEEYGNLLACVGTVFHFIRAHGLDPESIIREKHEYNKTRPYKHGKVC